MRILIKFSYSKVNKHHDEHHFLHLKKTSVAVSVQQHGQEDVVLLFKFCIGCKIGNRNTKRNRLLLVTVHFSLPILKLHVFYLTDVQLDRHGISWTLPAIPDTTVNHPEPTSSFSSLKLAAVQKNCEECTLCISDFSPAGEGKYIVCFSLHTEKVKRLLSIYSRKKMLCM